MICPSPNMVLSMRDFLIMAHLLQLPYTFIIYFSMYHNAMKSSVINKKHYALFLQR